MDEDHADFSSPSPPRRQRRQAARAIPPANEAQRALATALFQAITLETAGRDRFAGYTDEDFHQAAETLVRYRLSTLDMIRHTERGARRLFLSECREADQKPFTEMQLLMQLFSHFEPITAKQRSNIKDPAFEEIVLPRKLAAYAADLRGLGGFLKPNQPMVNYVSRELALGKLKVPSYTPYIVPSIAEVPWPVPSAEHKAAMVKWNSNRQAAKAAQPQPVPINAWVLYQLRFIFAADICGAWCSFGGIAAQLNHLSIVLHIATTEAVGIALTYDQLLKSHLEELARSRVSEIAGTNDFQELLSNENHRFKLQAIQQHTKPPKAEREQPPRTKKEVSKGKAAGKEKVPSGKPPGWLPKPEYLKKLAEDRKAAEASRQSRSPSRRRKPSRSRSRKQKPARSPVQKQKRRRR